MTDIRISTMVKVGKLSHHFDLKDLYSKLNVDKNIIYIEFNENKKGVNPKKKKDKKKYFYNQMTLLLKTSKIVNLKLFNNGSIQMTGIKSDRMAIEIADIITKTLTEIFGFSIEIINIKTVMINSDFDYGYTINNSKLQELIEYSNYYSSYEPCSYPGVNIKYYYNDNNHNKGICSCKHQCNGKGKDGHCKRITIAVFKSGNIIVTGGFTLEQIYIAKDFITNFIYDNKEHILLDFDDYILKIQRNYRRHLRRKIK